MNTREINASLSRRKHFTLLLFTRARARARTRLPISQTVPRRDRFRFIMRSDVILVA